MFSLAGRQKCEFELLMFLTKLTRCDEMYFVNKGCFFLGGVGIYYICAPD